MDQALLERLNRSRPVLHIDADDSLVEVIVKLMFAADYLFRQLVQSLQRQCVFLKKHGRVTTVAVKHICLVVKCRNIERIGLQSGIIMPDGLIVLSFFHESLIAFSCLRPVCLGRKFSLPHQSEGARNDNI